MFPKISPDSSHIQSIDLDQSHLFKSRLEVVLPRINAPLKLENSKYHSYRHHTKGSLITSLIGEVEVDRKDNSNSDIGSGRVLSKSFNTLQRQKIKCLSKTYECTSRNLGSLIDRNFLDRSVQHQLQKFGGQRKTKILKVKANIVLPIAKQNAALLDALKKETESNKLEINELSILKEVESEINMENKASTVINEKQPLNKEAESLTPKGDQTTSFNQKYILDLDEKNDLQEQTNLGKYSKRATKMTTKIRQTIGQSNLNYRLCEKYGLKPWDETLYKKLEMLGEGTYGQVWRCLEITGYIFTAVKYIKINEVSDEEERIYNLASFLVEMTILEKISDEGTGGMFPKYFGAFYQQVDNSDKVDKLILVSEAGDFNLDEIIKCRKIEFQKNPAYTPEEALNILRHLIPSFCALKKCRLYHSDIKTKNIVYSKQRKGFMLIDFGVSKEIPIKNNNEEDVFSLEDFAGDGTELFNSIEKKVFWQAAKANQFLDDENDQNYVKLSKEDSVFNPFKCDMWALGVCIERMVGNLQTLEDNPILFTIVQGLKKPDWRVRWDADQVVQFLESNGIKLPINIETQETLYLERLNQKRMAKEGLIELQKKYEDAYLPQEQLIAAQEEYKTLKSQKNESEEEDSFDFEPVLYRLGRAFRKMGMHQESLETWEKQRKLLLKMGRLEDSAEMTTVMLNIATAKSELGQYNESLAEFEEILNIRRKIFKTDENAGVATTMYAIAQLYCDLGMYQESLDRFQQVLVIRRKLFKTDENPSVLNTMYAIAQQMSNLGRYEEALDLFRNILEIRKRINRTEKNQDVATVMFAIAYQLSNLGFVQEALEHFQNVLEIEKIIFKSEENASVANTLFAIAQQYSRLGKNQEARELLEKILKIRMQLCKKEEDPSMASTLNELARISGEMGNHQESLEKFQHVLEIRKAIFKTEENPTVSSTIFSIAQQLSKLGKHKEALEKFEYVLDLERRIYKVSGMLTITSTKYAIAQQRSLLGNHQEALVEFQQVLEIRKRLFKTEKNASVSKAMYSVAHQLCFLGKYQEALEIFQHVLEIEKSLFITEEHLDILTTIFQIAKLYAVLGNSDQAIVQFTRVLDLAKKLRVTNVVIVSTYEMAELLKKLARYNEAVKHYETVLEMTDNTEVSRLVKRESIQACVQYLKTKI